ncbi:hypothetical protein AVEN_137102-1 [Araneus ventricosus]|uniref:Uncharacterized protein n=1 Tax=Araneus ventricosus TaxID=182803 RepID=A0A4Y2W4S0_ARAVE|nr:hypothetical protein AVEN_137102-1 [Araneus ventricosus]
MTVFVSRLEKKKLVIPKSRMTPGERHLSKHWIAEGCVYSELPLRASKINCFVFNKREKNSNTKLYSSVNIWGFFALNKFPMSCPSNRSETEIATGTGVRDGVLFCVMNVLFGIFFQKRSISSQLKTYWGIPNLWNGSQVFRT